MTVSRRRVRPTAGHAVDVTAGVLAVSLSGPLYLDFFDSRSYLTGFAAAVVAATAAAVLSVVRGWSAMPRLAVAAGGFVVLAVPVALSNTLHNGLPTARTAAELSVGIVSGWAKMLSVSLPAAVSGQLVVTLLLITWLATYGTVTIALTTSSPVAPALPPVLAFWTGLVMVATAPDTHLELTAATLAMLLVLVLRRARRATAAAVRTDATGAAAVTRRRAAWRASAAGAALGAFAITTGLAAAGSGMLGNGSHRSDPRPLDSQQLRTPDLFTPLATVQPQLTENPPRAVCTVTIQTGADRVPGIAVAALDHFDGAVWTTDDEFLTAGQRLTPDGALTAPTIVTAHIAVDAGNGLPSPFVPAVGRPVRIRFTAGQPDELGFSTVSGSLISTTPLASGTAYDVVGDLRSARDLDREARPSAVPADRADTALPPGLPPYLDQLTHRLTDADPSPVGKLAAINAFLRGLPYNVHASPGHSYADITRVVAATQTHDDGGDEQHAAAFAVMARDLGYPARVVVGYRLHGGDAGTFDVTTRDATAWGEVRFAGAGWVAYDPTDVNRKQRSAPPQVGAMPTPTPQPLDAAGIPRLKITVTPLRKPPPTTSLDPVELLLAALTAAVACATVCGAAVLAEKARRRYRRRHARGAPARVVGAWEESVDRLVELKLPIRPGMTPHEFARHTARALGGRAGALTDLAEPVTAAIFGPDGLTDADAVRAWRLAHTLRRDLYPGWARWRRPMAWLSPRPLYARHTVNRRGRRRKPG